MVGRNDLHLNQETMRAALEMYLNDARIVDSIKVVDVRQPGFGYFVVTIEGRKPV